MIPFFSNNQWRGDIPRLDGHPPRRLLLVRADRLGDFVLSTSCIGPVREQWPQAEIAFAVARPFAGLISSHPDVDVWSVDEQVQRIWVERMLDWGPDAVVFLNPHPVLEAAAAEARIPVRIGTSRGEGEHLTYWRPYAWKKQGHQHEAAYNFDLIEPLGLKRPGRWMPETFADARYDGPLPEAAQLIHLASHGDKPTLPPTFVAELAEALRARYGWVPVVVGSDARDPAIDRFLNHLPKELRKMVPVLAGKTTVSELAGLCHRACCMISRDSGPAHLATATGCPTLTIFLSQRRLMSPQRWWPLGPRSAVYSEPVVPIPFESPHGEARRIAAKLRPDAAVAALAAVINR